MDRAVATSFRRIQDVVARIPRGRVMTYGEVARAAGMGRSARVVAWALRAAERPLPWQRVVGSRRKGVAQITIKDPVGAALQRQLLEKEGVVFTRSGGIELASYGPKTKKPAPRGKGRPGVQVLKKKK